MKHSRTTARTRWTLLAACAAAAMQVPQALAEPAPEYPRPAKASKPYRLGVALPQLTPHFIAQAYGYFDEAAALGASVRLLDAGGYQFLDRQVSQVEDLIASKVDAIILVAVNSQGTVGVVDEAVAAGIPVVNCNVMTDSKKVIARVRSDDVNIGETQADVMGKALAGKGSVVMLRGAPGTSWAEVRGNAFKKRIAANYPGIKIIGEQYNQSTPPDGLKLMEDMMQTYPKIDGAYTGSDPTGIGAAQAVMAAGMKGKIVVTTADLQPDTEKLIRDGVITASVAQQSVVLGRWCTRVAINHLEKRPVPATLTTPVIVISKDNVATADMTGLRSPAGWKPPTH